MPENSTIRKVVNIDERRVRRTAEERQKRNANFTELILSRWSDTGPAGGQTLFNAILSKAIRGPIDTPERAKALLPVLLEVLDDMEARDGN